jgi:tol-pal system protein YbgF
MPIINAMTRRLLTIGVACLACSLSFAAAPVEEAQEYMPETDQAVVKAAPEEDQGGFRVTQSSNDSWKDSEKEGEETFSPVHESLSDERAPGSDSDSSSNRMSSDSRFLYLSQQVNNLTKLNFPAQVNDIQQEIAQLRGQFQDLERRIKTLEFRQESFYENINAQIKQLQNHALIPSNEASQPSSPAPEPMSSPAPAPAPMTSAASPSITSVSVEKRQTPVSPKVKLNETQAYEAAFTQLINKEYANAQQGFTLYLQDYPEGRYSGNVNYWLGEIALIEKRYREAEIAFSEVVTRYPDSGKLPDANYKLAITHLKMGQEAKAKVELAFVEKQYAGKTAARLAKLQLEQMG